MLGLNVIIVFLFSTTFCWNHAWGEDSNRPIDWIIKGIINRIHEHAEHGRTHKGKIPNIRDIMKNAKIHCNLAKSYGKLTKDSIKTMDSGLLVIMGQTLLEMSALNNPKWDEIKKGMDNNPMLEFIPHSEVLQKKHKIYRNSKDWNVHGRPDRRLASDVHSWFRDTIGNADVLADTSLNVDRLASLMSVTGAHVSSFGSLFFKRVHRNINIMDIGVLRMPDITKPQFDIYTIHMNAFVDIVRQLWHESKVAGVQVYFNLRSYRPKPSLVSKLSDSAVKIALDEIIALFD